MTEKELDKATKRELLKEREEKKRLEAKNLEKSIREAFFLRMEELKRSEEEMRETRMPEREKEKNWCWKTTREEHCTLEWKAKIDLIHQDITEGLLNFHISLYLYTIRNLRLLMSSQAARTAVVVQMPMEVFLAKTSRVHARHQPTIKRRRKKKNNRDSGGPYARQKRNETNNESKTPSN